MGYPSKSQNDTELHYSEVRRIFARTAAHLGMPEMWAKNFGQSVWHLCNRGYDGTTNCLVFLILNKDILTEIWGHPDYPFVDHEKSLVCPIWTGLRVAQHIETSHKNGDLEDFELIVGRSALPMLSLPLLTWMLKHEDYGFDTIQISGPSARISMSDAGMHEVCESLSHEFAWVGTENDIAKLMKFSLCHQGECEEGLFYPKRRHETLWLPTNRLGEDGILRL